MPGPVTPPRAAPVPDPRPFARTSPPFEPGPLTLTGRFVRLEPLADAHRDGLAEVALDEETWRWMPVQPTSRADLERHLDRATEAAADGREVPFVQVEMEGGRPIGMTRFLSIERAHRRLEIGYTWIAAPWRGTAVNTEAKLLLLGQAFDAWGAHRVEFKTDANNLRSRAAIAALGATQEGIFRRHAVNEAGRVRDSVYFSITWDEWPEIAARLEARVGARGATVPGMGLPKSDDSGDGPHGER